MCPGVIETNLGRDAPEELVKENLTPVIDATPLGRAGQPEEVAQVVCFLSSLRATYVNGSCMTVYSLQNKGLMPRWTAGLAPVRQASSFRCLITFLLKFYLQNFDSQFNYVLMR